MKYVLQSFVLHTTVYVNQAAKVWGVGLLQNYENQENQNGRYGRMGRELQDHGDRFLLLSVEGDERGGSLDNRDDVGLGEGSECRILSP